MSISLIDLIKSDLEFLQLAKAQNFQTVSCEKIKELVEHKINYKKNLSSDEEKKFYSSFKLHLIDICNSKFPFRIIEIIKKCLKQNCVFPHSISESFKNLKIEIPRQFSSVEEKEKALTQLAQTLIGVRASHEEGFKIVESILWIHGTNSAILPMLPHSNHTLLCTGELLDKGIAPMCGELYEGGMAADAVNQQ